jgi:hypothetical protein
MPIPCADANVCPQNADAQPAFSYGPHPACDGGSEVPGTGVGSRSGCGDDAEAFAPGISPHPACGGGGEGPLEKP